MSISESCRIQLLCVLRKTRLRDVYTIYNLYATDIRRLQTSGIIFYMKNSVGGFRVTINYVHIIYTQMTGLGTAFSAKKGAPG